MFRPLSEPDTHAAPRPTIPCNCNQAYQHHLNCQTVFQIDFERQFLQRQGREDSG